MKAIKAKDLVLTCEYLKAPLGIENAAPRFAWKGEGSLATAKQCSYQINVWNAHGSVWDSGEVSSSQSCGIEYAGAPLQSATRYSWNVRITTEHSGECYESDTAYFETGLLSADDWAQAKWIAAPVPKRGVAPLLRRVFQLDTIPQVARLYLSGLGYAEVTINGHKLDGSRLDPGWTDYRKTVLYRAWDVGAFLQTGENVLAVELGEGWYGNDHAGFKTLIGRLPDWLGTPRLISMLALDEKRIISTNDGSWLVSEGAVQNNNLYDGEYYDARLEKEGWQLAGYRPSPTEWTPAAEVAAPGGRLRCQLMPPITEVAEVKPFSITYAEDGGPTEVVVDMGENIAGWAAVTMHGKPGQTVRLQYGEVLTQTGNVNRKNMRDAASEDIFVLGKEGETVYHPRFAYHGFRYLQIITAPGVIITKVRGFRVHTAVEQTGSFSCGNELLNNIQRAVLRTELNNLHSVPTDCPQRNERLAWLNDMTVRFEEALFNFDMILFYEKWLNDISDAQDRDTGAVPDTAPFFFGGMPACHVSSVYVLLPWMLYSFYRDSQPMRTHYESIKRYVAFKLNAREANGLLPEAFFGEWAAPMTESQLGWGENAVPKNIPQQLVTTGYLYYDCTVMEQMAQLLGHPADAAFYADERARLKHDLNAAFLRKEGYYAENTQGANTFPLFLGIVPDDRHQLVLDHLLNDLISERSYRITTGNQMTKYLYEVLEREGYSEQAYRTATCVEYPSIGYMLNNGATTIWERWEKMSGNHMNSHDHPMLGAFTIWFYKGLCGIQPQRRAQNGDLLLQPSVVEGLSFAQATVQTPCGALSLCWKQDAAGVTLTVEVPWNSTVQLVLPKGKAEYKKITWNGAPASGTNSAPLELASGTHQLVCSY